MGQRLKLITYFVLFRGYILSATYKVYTELKILKTLKCIRSRHGQSISIISVATGQRLVVKVTLLITLIENILEFDLCK